MMIPVINVPNMGTLAKCRSGNIIYIREGITPHEFAEYFRGNRSGKSEEKATVLKELEKHGWPLDKILELTPTTKTVRRFLILHELSHIRHLDCQHRKNTNEEERIQIETRACLEALIQMKFEQPYTNPNKPDPCAIPTSSANSTSEPSSWGFVPN